MSDDDLTTAYMTGFHKRDDEVADLKAEIERLREEAKDRSDLADEAMELVHEQEAEIERLRGLVDACAIYLKEDETPAQRIERERADTDAVLKILLKEKLEVDRLRQQVTQRGARLQLIREWMEICPSGPTQNLWVDFTYDNPEAAEWFDADGVPR